MTRASLAAPEAGALPNRFAHDAVRAQLDLPDFFENLAGNHLEPKINYATGLTIGEPPIKSFSER